MSDNIPESELDKLKTPFGRRAHLAECRERLIAVMGEIASNGSPDDSEALTELAESVTDLARVVHGLTVYLEVQEAS